MDFEKFLRAWHDIVEQMKYRKQGDGELSGKYSLQEYAAMHEDKTLQQILEEHYEREALEYRLWDAGVFRSSWSSRKNWKELNDAWRRRMPTIRAEMKARGVEFPKQEAPVVENRRAQEHPVELPGSREEALDKIDEISNRLAEFVNKRREARDYLQSREDTSDQELYTRSSKLDGMQIALDKRATSLQTDLEKLGGYLNHRDDRIFDKNARKTLRKLQADIRTNLDKWAVLNPKIEKETDFIGDRCIEIREPVGTGHNLIKALEAFRVIQDKKLGWRRTGAHANEFNAIKEIVGTMDDFYPGIGDKMVLYNACYTYLSKHTADGSHIGGQKSEVGRLRKQAVVNILQVLSNDAEVREALAEEQAEAERDEPNRIQLNFGELEKSLAKATKMQKVDNKYLVGTKRRAYAELKEEKKKEDAAFAAALQKSR